MFDPSKLGVGRSLNQKIVEWVKDSMPKPIKEALRSNPAHILINCREVQCGDPTCSPIDVAVAMIFSNGRRATTGMPMEMKDVRREDVASALVEMTEELLACHHDTPWVPPHLGPPPLTEAGQRALAEIARVVKEQCLPLSPGDVQGVCVLTMDLLEQLEDDAARPPGAPRGAPMSMLGGPGALPPQAMDPHTKILAAAQRDDAPAIREFLEAGIPASYANSLGQTPLHISAMWGNAAALEVLIKAGANVNAQNQLSSASPLHVAAASNKAAAGRIACVSALLRAGADARLLDADGKAPFEKVSARADDEELADILQDAYDRAQAGGMVVPA